MHVSSTLVLLALSASSVLAHPSQPNTDPNAIKNLAKDLNDGKGNMPGNFPSWLIQYIHPVSTASKPSATPIPKPKSDGKDDKKKKPFPILQQ